MLAIAVVAAAVSWAVVPLVVVAARRLDIIDRPVARSSHSVPTPRGGGLAILAGAGAGLAVAGTATELWPLAIAVTAVSAVGLVDDMMQLRPEVRLCVQVASAAALAVGAGYRIAILDGEMAFAGLPALLLTIIWLTGSTNAFNFMDGINGIASTQAIIWGVTLAVLFRARGDFGGASIAIAVAAAAAGFLPWNFPKARVFMGDVGSAALGFAFAALAVRYSRGGGSLSAAVLPFLPFLLDTTATLIRRAMKGERLMSAHRSHYYQLLVVSGWSHASVTALWAALACAGAASATVFEHISPAGRAALLSVLLVLHGSVGIAITVRERERARHSGVSGRPEV